MKVIFDAEADGLLLVAKRMWILSTFVHETKDRKTFLENDLGWQDQFNNATHVIGHNIMAYDLPLLEKLFGYKLPKHVTPIDTMILSQVLNYKRFGTDGHSLGRWGEALGHKKPEHEDWSQYSEEMRIRNTEDVEITVKVFDTVRAEYQALLAKEPKIKFYIRAEHAAAKWCATASLHGWPFDVPAAKTLYENLETSMGRAYTALNEKLGMKCVAVDKKKGIVEEKRPKWTKQGCYDVHTANWFNIDPWSGFEGEARPILGPYSRVEFQNLSLDSVTDVKTFLYRHGWQPTEWNYKIDEDTGKKVKSSPKISEDSLEFLGGDGKLYTEFLTARSRYGILKTWLENTDENGMLHGDCMLVGTPSMRARHSIIVNVPSADSPWGKEMRSLFTCLPGWKLIGCDSSGNQARGLAHYLGDEKFIDTLLNGDIHQYNADVLTAVLKSINVDFVVKRSQAKRILYAFLFGASGGKLWSYIFGVIDDIQGKKLKNGFLKAVPGFKALLEKLESIYGKTSQFGDGYIPSLAGNRIYVDSFHKLLVYLLQSAEKITCASALMLTVEALEKENIPYIPCIFYHDEIDFMVPEQYAERAGEIGKKSFAEGPKLFGITIMDGGAKIGNSWYDVH